MKHELRLPAIYAEDYVNRCDGLEHSTGIIEAAVTSWHGNTATVTLNSSGLADLISDVKHYTDPEMAAEFIAEGNGRLIRSARATRSRLEKLGLA